MEIDEIREKMLRQYVTEQLNYVDFTSYMENKIKTIIIENSIKYQSISSRVKTYESLEKKLSKEKIDGIHQNIKKLNDLSGVRIIFYNDNELNNFINQLYNYFEVVNNKHSQDKMEYDGVNITVKIKDKFNKFSTYLCEIQLTTVLSHVMNEFGHNILYKDIDELESKDKIEYDKIKEIFNNAKKKIIEVTNDLDVINTRVEGIKKASENLNFFIDGVITTKIKKVKSIIELDTLIDKMIYIIPMLNKYEDKTEQIKNLNIVYEIAKRFEELPRESAQLLSYDTYEYKYDKLLEFLVYYQYLWIEKFKDIISEVYKIAEKNNFLNKFDKFIEKLLINDKVESIKGNAGYYTHTSAYNIIQDETIELYIRVKFAEYFCSFHYSSIDEVDINKYSISQGNLQPNEEYIKKINFVLKILLDIFINNQSEYILKTIININSEIEYKKEYFKKNIIYDFFFKNYNKINIYCKNELYKSECFKKESLLFKSSFYKKLKSDDIQKLFAVMTNWNIEEIPRSKYIEKQDYKKQFLEQYSLNLKKSDVKKIIEIIDVLDVYDATNYDVYNSGMFLVNVGKNKKYGELILNQRWNKYIALGAIYSLETINEIIKEENKLIDIVEAITTTSIYNENILNYIMDYSEKSFNLNVKLSVLKLISNIEDLILKEKYEKYIIRNIEYYNQNNIGVMDKIYNIRTEDLIVAKYTYDEIQIIIENFKYSELNQSNEFMLKNIFEKYPKEFRNIIRYKVERNSKMNMNNIFRYSNLTECSNYNDEKYNNLILVFELLKSNEYNTISNYIHYLIGEFNDVLKNDIIKYINNNQNNETYKIVIDLLRLLDVSIDGWDIYEYIISHIEESDELLNSISCLLINTRVVYREYGLSETFYKKAQFLKKTKNKNKKVKKFLENEVKQLENLAIIEKDKVDKQKALTEINYLLDHKKDID